VGGHITSTQEKERASSPIRLAAINLNWSPAWGLALKKTTFLVIGGGTFWWGLYNSVENWKVPGKRTDGIALLPQVLGRSAKYLVISGR